MEINPNTGKELLFLFHHRHDHFPPAARIHPECPELPVLPAGDQIELTASRGVVSRRSVSGRFRRTGGMGMKSCVAHGIQLQDGGNHPPGREKSGCCCASCWLPEGQSPPGFATTPTSPQASSGKQADIHPHLLHVDVLFKVERFPLGGSSTHQPGKQPEDHQHDHRLHPNGGTRLFFESPPARLVNAYAGPSRINPKRVEVKTVNTAPAPSHRQGNPNCPGNLPTTFRAQAAKNPGTISPSRITSRRSR